MANKKTKIDRLHELIPKLYKTRVNPNWKSLIEALGQEDENLTQLIREVKDQFFVRTAERPHIDSLGANVKVQRPRFVGMDDETFRRFIPIMAYQPRQVKSILDDILDIFFFKEATTAFTQSGLSQPFNLSGGWTLEYTVDGDKQEKILFKASDFTDINNATIDEVVSAINRQAKYSYAIPFDDRVKREQFIRIFTNTIGSKGSIQIDGGLANLAFEFIGFSQLAGSESNTIWTITKVGDTMTFQHTGGNSPNLVSVQEGDIAIINIPGNEGTFVVDEVNVSESSFSFTNLFGTAGVFDHTSDPDSSVNFISPEKTVVYDLKNRAVVWEVTPGEIIVEIPASPPVVRRELAGSAHINGLTSTVTDRPSADSLELDDASDWPETGGMFVIQQLQGLQKHIVTISEDVVEETEFNTRFNKQEIYQYTSRVGNTLTGITPDLPASSSLYEIPIDNVSNDGAGIVTVTTTAPHGFNLGEVVAIRGTTPDVDGSFEISEVVDNVTFRYGDLGSAGVSTGGEAIVERVGMKDAGSLVHLTSARLGTGLIGPYVWDLNAPFVLSSLTTNIGQQIRAGTSVKTLQIAQPNNIPNEEGFIIFDYGTEKEEGPVRYLFKPTDGSVQLDPSYVFEFTHDSGSAITVIRRRGAIIMSGRGTELAPYITDPAVAREALQELMLQVKSVGIFINFLVRYPEQIYSTLDVYKSGSEDLYRIREEDEE